MTVQSLFLQCSVEKLTQFMSRIEVCVGKLSDEQVWTRDGENQNAIGNILLHLARNLRQWMLAGLGGNPFTRDRDGEFDARGGASAIELMANLRAVVEQSTRLIAGLNEAQLTGLYEIQKYSVSGVQAVFHVVEHFAMHTGQIIFATKILTGEDLGFYKHLRGSAQREEVSGPGLP